MEKIGEAEENAFAKILVERRRVGGKCFSEFSFRGESESLHSVVMGKKLVDSASGFWERDALGQKALGQEVNQCRLFWRGGNLEVVENEVAGWSNEASYLSSENGDDGLVEFLKIRKDAEALADYFEIVVLFGSEDVGYSRFDGNNYFLGGNRNEDWRFRKGEIEMLFHKGGQGGLWNKAGL